ncbi:MAG: kinase/pyrophosphorylase [Tissierellia bacterium]|nr:kinase/pyrophosphorylase [Tissierellia bacterium]
MDDHLVIYVLSDSVGETGELIARASARQFGKNYEIKRYPFLHDLKGIEEVFEEAKNDRWALVIYTTVKLETRKLIRDIGNMMKIPTIDVMGPPMEALQQILNYEPKREPGLIRRLDENYFKKVEAIEFAVKYDDGKDPRGVVKADVCLVGISRTSKTPLSMYLANRLLKVANVPLVPEVPPPPQIFEKDPRRVFGLVANPYKINEIRLERLKALGLESSANYANVERIYEELKYSREIMEKIGCPVIDVSNRAIEETAGKIIEMYEENFPQF